jgi:hypothetical protein
MPNSDNNNIFDPHPAAASDPNGPFEPSSPAVAGLFEEPTADDQRHVAPQDADFEQRYRAVLAEELESGGVGGHERRRSLAFALPSGGLARQLVVGAICAIAALLIASIAISLFHGSRPEVKSTATTPAPAAVAVSGHAHRTLNNPHGTSPRRLPRVRHATPRAPTRRPVERQVPRRRAIVSTSPAVPAVPAAPTAPAAVVPSPAPRQVFVPPSYTLPVHVPAPQSPPNSEFGFER